MDRYYGVICLLLAFTTLLPPLIYWKVHPTLSQMEVFLAFWPLVLAGLIGELVLLFWANYER